MWPGRQRVVRCYRCPPELDLNAQLESIRVEVQHQEAKHRKHFEALDRMERWAGPSGEHHTCTLPAIVNLDSAQTFVCPECAQKWRKPFYYGWRPE